MVMVHPGVGRADVSVDVDNKVHPGVGGADVSGGMNCQCTPLY